jgi:hypothetical protein
MRATARQKAGEGGKGGEGHADIDGKGLGL